MGKVKKATKRMQKTGQLQASIKHRKNVQRVRKAKREAEERRGKRGGREQRACVALRLLASLESLPVPRTGPAWRHALWKPAIAAAEDVLELPPPPLPPSRPAASKRPEGGSDSDDEQGGKPRKALEDMSIDEFLDGGFLDAAHEGPGTTSASDDEGEAGGFLTALWGAGRMRRGCLTVLLPCQV